jgi:hypothetical protein
LIQTLNKNINGRINNGDQAQREHSEQKDGGTAPAAECCQGCK